MKIFGKTITSGIIVMAGMIAVLVFYYVFDPMLSRFMPQCVFHRFTGLNCVGCGSQRMLHALLHGDVAGALRANAIAFLSIPFILFLLWLETQRTKRQTLYARVYSKWFILLTGGVFVLWFIVRNILQI